MNTGNWDEYKFVELCLADDDNRTQRPISKLIAKHDEFCKQKPRQSVNWRVEGKVARVSDAAGLYIKPVDISNVENPFKQFELGHWFVESIG